MCISLENRESASDETKGDHEESTNGMTTPEYLEDLGDTELSDGLCLAEVGASERTLGAGGGITAIALSGDARGEPSLVYRAFLMFRWGCGGLGRGLLFGIVIKIRVRVRDRRLCPESVTEQEVERIFQ